MCIEFIVIKCPFGRKPELTAFFFVCLLRLPLYFLRYIYNDYDEETPNHNNWYFCPDFYARKCEGSRQKSILLTSLGFTVFWANVTHLLILEECQQSKKEIHLLQPAAEQRSWVWLTREQERASWPAVSLQMGVRLSQQGQKE